MRSRKKGRAPRMTLADLKPAEQITCFMCNQPPAASRRMYEFNLVWPCAPEASARRHY